MAKNILLILSSLLPFIVLRHRYIKKHKKERIVFEYNNLIKIIRCKIEIVNSCYVKSRLLECLNILEVIEPRMSSNPHSCQKLVRLSKSYYISLMAIDKAIHIFDYESAEMKLSIEILIMSDVLSGLSKKIPYLTEYQKKYVQCAINLINKAKHYLDCGSYTQSEIKNCVVLVMCYRSDLSHIDLFE